jgi:hypothetical protein
LTTITTEIAATRQLVRILQQNAGNLDPRIVQDIGVHGDLVDTNELTINLGGHVRWRLALTIDYADPDLGNVTRVYWSKHLPRVIKIMTALSPAHYAAPFECWSCHQPLGNGQPVELLVIGPELEDQERHDRGEFYLALAVFLHARCLEGRDVPAIQQSVHRAIQHRYKQLPAQRRKPAHAAAELTSG